MVPSFKKLLGRKQSRPHADCQPLIVITEECLSGIQGAIAPEAKIGHEGVAYLLGRTDGMVTVATTAIRPEAQTSQGSFEVDQRSMARVVRTAADLHLQVVGQVHTHPRIAFHSDGDSEGARIAYSGYVSIVLPNCGRELPSLKEAAFYMFSGGKGFKQLSSDSFTIVPGSTK